ncbi:MAG: hypothetical protein GY943_17115 [Chloroflexi bacterium]|nr:hypothetical protein [Chloroflexota bacterium]
MKRLLFLLMMLFVVACGSATETTPVQTDASDDVVDTTADEAVVDTFETETEAPAEINIDEETAVVEAPEEIVAEEEEVVEEVAAEEAVEEVETAVTSSHDGIANFVAATTPAEAGEARSVDWVKGAEDPDVVIIEYGDFQ